MKQIVIVLAALVAVAFIWWQAATVDLIPDLGKPPPDTGAAADSTVGAPASGADATGSPGTREAADPAPAVDGPVADDGGEPQPAAEAPRSLRLLIVDGAGEPVGAAEVAVFEDAGRRRGVELIRLRSDAAGRCDAPVTGALIVSARRADVGWSGDVLVRARGPDEPARVVLLATATVRGRVTLPDGQPAVGALVWGRSSAYAEERTDRVPGQRTDADGRFEVQVVAGRGGDDHTFGAQLDGRHSEQVQVPQLSPGEVVDIHVRFPGAFRVRGDLLTENGDPLPGRVWLVRKAGTPGRALFRTEADSIGAFEFLLVDGGEFTVVGGVEGRTSAVASVRLEPGAETAEVELRTRPFAAVSGRVVDEGGAPLGGVFVGLSFDFERDAVERQRSSLHGNLPRGDTAADGTFSFLAPAGYRLQLVARPVAGNRNLLVRGPRFVSPAQGLTLTIGAADRQGFVLFGDVTSRSSGQPIASATVQMVTKKGSGSSMGKVGVVENGSYETEILAPSGSAWFEIQASGYAPMRHGPIDLGIGRRRLDFALPDLGTMRVRVHRPDGTPAVGYRVMLGYEPYDPFGPAWQGKTNAEGMIEFEKIIPRDYRVIARAPTEAGGEGETPATVVSGERSDVEVFIAR